MALQKLTKGQQTQKRFVEAAILLFSQNGFEKTSFQMIADACKVSQSAPLYHFKNKEGLLEAVMLFIWNKSQEQIAEAFKKDDNAYQRLLKFFKVNVSRAIIFKAETETQLVFFYQVCFNQRLASLYREILISSRGEIEELLLAGKREGILHFEMSSDHLAQNLYDALLGFQINVLAGKKESFTMSSMEKRISSFLIHMVGYKK